MVNSAVIKTIDLSKTYQKIKQLEVIKSLDALTAYTNLILQAQSAEDFVVQTDCLISSSQINKRHGAYYKALHQSGTALQLINLHLPTDNMRLAIVYKELGAIYADGFQKSSIALNYFFKGLKCNIPSLNVNFYNNIGSIYKDLGNYDESLKHLHIGKALVAPDEERIISVFILENIGGVYTKLKAYKNAEESLLEAKAKIRPDGKYDYIGGFVLNSLAEVYLKTNRSEEAIILIEEALKKAKDKKHTAIIVESYKNKSSYALQMGDEAGFIENINAAIEFTVEDTMSILQIGCLKLLKDFYWERKNYKEACLIADQIIEVKTQMDRTREHNSVAELLEKRASEIMILENNNRMIGRQKDELEQFAYIVAHDLKEPIRNIGSYSGLVKRRYETVLDEEGKEFLNFIIKNATHMYSMLEDLLKYATVKNDTEQLESIEPNVEIEEMLYRFKDKIQETGTTIVVDKLPPTPIRSIHFNVLIENLIKNSIKFRVSERPLKIHIKAIESKQEICFSITDNGTGIESKYHQSIFQIFKRLEKTKYTGTGIGLSICKKIVEVYQGMIWVDSTPGEGSTFFFKIKK